MVKDQTFFGKLFGKKPIAMQEEPDASTQHLFEGVTTTTNLKEMGSSGTKIYGGTFDEEYLSDLVGTTAADTYDKMRRGDAVVKMCVSAARNPLLRANWEIDPGSVGVGQEEKPEYKEHAEFVEHVIFNDQEKTWKETLREILSFLEFGHSVFEVTHKVVLDHPRFGSYNGIRTMGFRSQRTLENWKLDRETGKIIHVEQIADGELERRVKIPGEALVVFTLDREGDNIVGISALRSLYGAWFRKQTYLKLMAIGVEKAAVPTPKGKYPKNATPQQIADFKETLRRYTSHHANFVLGPADFDLEFVFSQFDAGKVQGAVEFENMEMVRAFMAQFLMLGSSGSGSYALSFDLSDFFLGGIEHLGDIVCEKFNRQIIPQLVQMKYGPQEVYPTMLCNGISDKLGAEFSTMLKTLGDGKWLTPADRDEEHLRKRIGMPKPSEEGKRAVAPAPAMPTPAPAQTFAETESGIQFGERTPKSIISEAKDDLDDFMRASLLEIGSGFVDSLMSAYRKLGDNQKLSAVKNATVPAKALAAYRKELLERMTDYAHLSLVHAKKEIPKFRDIKLMKERRGAFEDLPKSVQKRLRAESALLVDTQMGDLHKNVLFQYTSSVGSTGDVAVLEDDVRQAVRTFSTEGAAIGTAASKIASVVVNEARNAFFFDEEVLDEIESFTFINGDPVSPICQDLAGQTFRKDDPEAERYFPPLHYNCKSTLRANLKGNKSARAETGKLKPSKSDLEKYITFGEDNSDKN